MSDMKNEKAGSCCSHEHKEPCGCGHDKKPCACQQGWPLLASVALNLFMIGMVAAPLFWGRPPEAPIPPMGGAPGPFMIERMASQLAVPDAEKLRAIYAGEKEGMAENRMAMHAAFAHLGAALEQEQPDQAALTAAMDELRQAGVSMHEGMAKALTRVATELSLDARRKIAAEMQHGPMGGPPLGGPPLGGPLGGEGRHMMRMPGQVGGPEGLPQQAGDLPLPPPPTVGGADGATAGQPPLPETVLPLPAPEGQAAPAAPVAVPPVLPPVSAPTPTPTTTP